MCMLVDARLRVIGVFCFLMIRRPPRSTLDRSSAASDVYKRQIMNCTKTCPKGLNPAKAIAEIKRMMVERIV